ncbi:unnamed protein product [Gadus morhua 'NCC']
MLSHTASSGSTDLVPLNGSNGPSSAVQSVNILLIRDQEDLPVSADQRWRRGSESLLSAGGQETDPGGSLRVPHQGGSTAAECRRNTFIPPLIMVWSPGLKTDAPHSQ